jgi:hypothetical protein
VLRIRDDDRWRSTRLLLAYPAVHAVVPSASARRANLLVQLPRALRILPDDNDAIMTNYPGGPASRADGCAMPNISPDIPAVAAAADLLAELVGGPDA